MRAGRVPAIRNPGLPPAAWRHASICIRDITERKRIAAQVRILKGLLPVCASCKQIRDDKGCWHKIEAYIRDHSEAEFSHGICPKCAERLYPEFNPYKE